MKSRSGTHHGAKKAELSARDFRMLVENSADVIWRTDGEFRFTYVSSSVERLLGVRKADVVGRLLWEFVPPGVRERIERLAAENLGGRNGPRENRYDIPMLRSDGSIVLVEVNLKTIVDAEGATIGLHGVTRDITERRQAEEEIAEWKQRYEYIAAASGQIAYERSSAMDTIKLGGSVEKVLGYKPQELSGKLSQWVELIDPDEREEATRLYEECLGSGRPFEAEYGLLHRDGHYVRVVDRGFVIQESEGRPARMIGAMQDITERKRTEAALRKSEARYRKLFAAAKRQARELKLLDRVRTALARELELPLVFRTVVEGIAEAFGYTQVSLHLLQGDVLHCQHQVGYSRIIEQIPVTRGITGRVVRTGEAALVPDVRADPDFIEAMAGIVSEVCIPLRDEGRVVGTLNVESTAGVVMGEADLRLMAALGEHVSIAIKKARLYAEARASEERYRLLVENLGVGVMIVDPEEGIVLSNPAAESVFGVPRGGLIGRNLKEFLSKEEFARVLEQSRIRRTGQSSTFELDISRPDGGVRRVRVTATPHRNEQGEYAGAFGMFHDITEARKMEQALRQSEERLAQAQKMEAVGRLAGGIAHDFNNLLTVISGYTDMIDEGIPDSHPVKPDIRQIRKAAERAADLTAQLLAFSRKQVLQPKVINLNETVRGMEAMLLRVIGEDIQLDTSLLPDAGNVKADRGQIEQVIVNLAANARDAMPTGGRLTIQTGNRTIDSSYEPVHPEVKQGHYVMLTVRDTGLGMTRETLSRIFEPFFTTKEVGKGTGLGLAMVYGIVKQSGGYIYCESDVGRGTTFTLYFPRVLDASPEGQKAPAPEAAEGGRETILLVEDEEAVRKLSRTVLEKSGYTVIEAGSGEEALAAISTLRCGVRLLLSDVVMPQMSGPELGRRVREICPGVRILYMSGYAQSSVVHHGVLDPEVDLIQKPFMASALLRRVREVLDR